MVKALAAVLLLILAVADSPPTAQEQDDWRELARRSSLVIEGIVLEPDVPIERPELRSAGDPVVGGLTRLRVDAILKADGQVQAGEVVEVVAPDREPSPLSRGTRYLFFLEIPFKLAGQDAEAGWRSLEGAKVKEAGTGREVPFAPSRAYGATAPALYSKLAARSVAVSADNLEVIDAIRRQVAIAVDKDPPTIQAVASPSRLWPATGSLVPIVVKVSAADGVDPSPRVRLRWIISNEPLQVGDVTDAALGTDDRDFSLRAAHAGAFRIYEITYEATDGGGNSARATTRVRVAPGE